MIAALIPALLPILGSVLERIIPNAEERRRAEAELAAELLKNQHALQRIAADVVRAEAQGESWLQRSWRPLVMLTFAGLIVARWLGWTAPNLTESEYLQLWSIVELGIGGYVIGRSVEKVVGSATPAVADALQKWRAKR